MYFNFEDYRPDTPTLPRSLTRLEVGLLTLVFYLSVVILLLVWPHLAFVKAWEAERQQAARETAAAAVERQRENARFVFVQPRVDLQARQPPPRADLSDLDRKARTVERAEKPTNTMPFSRGNTFERIEGAPPTPQQRAQEAAQPDAKADAERQAVTLPESPTAVEPKRRRDAAPARTIRWRHRRRDPQRAEVRASRSFVNLQGGGDQDSARRFSSTPRASSSGRGSAASSRRCGATGSIPNAAMSRRGTSSITFNVAQGRPHHRAARCCGRPTSTRSTTRRSARWPHRTRRSRCRRSIPTTARSSPSRSTTTKPRDHDAGRRGRSSSACCCCWPRLPRWRSCAQLRGADGASARRRGSRADRDRQERARARARAALRRRDRQLRFDRGLSRLRHRHRQGAARRSGTASRTT